MAHFAEINTDGTVLRVLVVGDDQQHRGQEFLADDLGLGGTWVRTRYNTRAGRHGGGQQAVGGTVAGPGFRYDARRDRFVPPRPFASWTLDEATGLWEAPVPRPDGVGLVVWDEAASRWTAP